MTRLTLLAALVTALPLRAASQTELESAARTLGVYRCTYEKVDSPFRQSGNLLTADGDVYGGGSLAFPELHVGPHPVAGAYTYKLSSGQKRILLTIRDSEDDSRSQTKIVDAGIASIGVELKFKDALYRLECRSRYVPATKPAPTPEEEECGPYSKPPFCGQW